MPGEGKTVKVRAWVFWRPACRADEARVGRDGTLGAADEAEWAVASEELAALALARAVAGDAVEVISWVPEEAEPTLRQVFGFGARRVWRVAEPAVVEDDVVATARGLVEAAEVASAAAAAVAGNNAADDGDETGNAGNARDAGDAGIQEVLFFGPGSFDYRRGAVGPAVAGVLGCPFCDGVTDVTQILALLERPERRDWSSSGRRAAVVVVGTDAPQPPKPSVIALARTAGRAIDTLSLTGEGARTAQATVRVTGRESVVPRRRIGEVLPENPEEAVHLLISRLRERRVF